MKPMAYIVAIVGPDASGKTTQARLLTERLQADGYDARYIHGLYHFSDAFPYATQIRKRIGPRKLRTDRQKSNGLTIQMFRMLFDWFSYIFALATIVFVTVRSRNQIIVFDRYYHQFFFDVYGPRSVSLSRSLPTPWKTIYLDGELAVLRPRMNTLDRAVDATYHTKVIDHYAMCATEDWLRYPAELPIRTLHERIFEKIRTDLASEDIREQTSHSRSEAYGMSE